MAATPATAPKKERGLNRDNDVTLGWVARKFPQLEAWRALGIEWLNGEHSGIGERLSSLSVFFERYLVKQNLPLVPADFLSRSTVLPDFYATACTESARGVAVNNHISVFLDFVLLRDFSEQDDLGRFVVSPAFYNPIPRRSIPSVFRKDESVHTPLPYGYIDELRRILVQGPTFKDWTWAQDALGVEEGESGRPASDWFPVPESLIDRDDPDCVWRVRPRKYGYKPILEMWSPVRWVALLVKLVLPLRTMQVRVLDSGEADTWRYDKLAAPVPTWTPNQHPLTHHLAQAGRKLVQQGVLRRSEDPDAPSQATTVLYVNTNKTADIRRSGAEKGYVLPWLLNSPLHEDVFYWLEKLRNWQSKYNPVRQRTPWTELDRRHLAPKSDMQLASYAPACFLFRQPEFREGERHLPMTEVVLPRAWYFLLEELQQRLAARGETHANGAPITLVPSRADSNGQATTLFPLHSLRVSLITALALEGKVPFPILQKLVGHSRLLMTLYYTKPGASRIRETLLDAAKRLDEKKEASIQNFLLDSSHEQLVKTAICNSPSSLAAAVPEHTASRNPAGWLPMHHGLCLVGGNTSELEDNKAIGGCFNGGAVIGPPALKKFGPVPGGSRNCVRCRWFVTEPHHLPALAAHFNNIAYHFDEARNACMTHEGELQALKRQKAAAEANREPFTGQAELRQAERVWESHMKRFSDLAEDLVACWRLIERCQKALEEQAVGKTQLVPVGSLRDVQAAFEETESELLQLSGVCADVEVYPDLEPGKAVIRRSQLLDSALSRDDLKPIFMHLSEREQLRAGNAFMRRLAQQMDPADPILGMRQVVQLMDAGERLGDYLGIDLQGLLPAAQQATQTLRLVEN